MQLKRRKVTGTGLGTLVQGHHGVPVVFPCRRDMRHFGIGISARTWALGPLVPNAQSCENGARGIGVGEVLGDAIGEYG